MRTFETTQILITARQAYRSAANRLTSGTLVMYNRGTHQNIAHRCPILNASYDGVRSKTIDTTNHTSGGWHQIGSILRDGGKLTCSVFIELDDSGKLYRRSLFGAMVDQTIERFTIEIANPSECGYSAFTLNAFVFVASNLCLGNSPATKVDLEISGELGYEEA